MSVREFHYNERHLVNTEAFGLKGLKKKRVKRENGADTHTPKSLSRCFKPAQSEEKSCTFSFR